MRRAPKSARLHHLLLIEDEPVIAQWVADLLAEFPGGHFQLAGHAESLQDGLAKLKSAHFDMILLDLNLPDSGGIETFLRVHGEAGHLPIIVLSGLDDEELASKLVHLGAQEYLVKARLDSQTLQRALRYAMERFHAEAELANERGLLQTLLENIPDRIYFKDKQSRFTRINQALKQLFHLARVEEAYGRTDADFYGEEHARPALEDERCVMQSGEPIINKVEREVSLTGLSPGRSPPSSRCATARGGSSAPAASRAMSASSSRCRSSSGRSAIFSAASSITCPTTFSSRTSRGGI